MGPTISICAWLLSLANVCDLRPIDLQCELVEFAGEAESHLVVVGHRRADVGADVKVLVPLHD